MSRAALRGRGAAVGGFMLVLYVAIGIAIGAVQSRLGPTARPVWTVVALTLGAIAGVPIYRRAIRLAERRDAAEMPAHPSPGALWGLLVGIGMLTLTQVIVVAGGAERIEGIGGYSHLLPALAASLFAAVWEEAIFRGVLFRLLDEWRGPKVALAGSAIVFGGMHAMNPGATWLSSVAIAIEAGVMLALAFMLTRTLWFAIGIHGGWNFAEGGIFGSAVSGNAAHGLFKVSSNGSALWTGGSFGLEASIPAICVGVGTSVVLWMMVRRTLVPSPRN